MQAIQKKVAMVGLWGVGKTSLVRQFVDQCFDDKYLSTLGVKIDKKPVVIDGNTVNLVLWDIAGAEDNFSVPMHYIKGATSYLLIADGTRPESLAAARELEQQIAAEVGDLPHVWAVNKNDLDWQVSSAEIDKLSAGQTWFSTSAKSGENVEILFQTLAAQLLG